MSVEKFVRAYGKEYPDRRSERSNGEKKKRVENICHLEGTFSRRRVNWRNSSYMIVSRGEGCQEEERVETVVI